MKEMKSITGVRAEIKDATISAQIEQVIDSCELSIDLNTLTEGKIKSNFKVVVPATKTIITFVGNASEVNSMLDQQVERNKKDDENRREAGIKSALAMGNMVVSAVKGGLDLSDEVLAAAPNLIKKWGAVEKTVVENKAEKAVYSMKAYLQELKDEVTRHKATLDAEREKRRDVREADMADEKANEN